MTQRDSHLKPFDFAASEEPDATPERRGRGRALALLLVVLLAAGAGYLWYFDRERANRWLQRAPVISGPSVTTAYKWRDGAGNWQITDRPPAQGIPYETIEVRSDVNIVPAFKQSE